jgi:hypothetical protein
MLIASSSVQHSAEVASASDGERPEKSTVAQTSVPYRRPKLGPQRHGHRQALRVGRVSVYRVCRRLELQAEAEDHAKFVVTGFASAYLLRQ